MRSGIVSLQPIYEFVRGDENGYALKGRSPAGREYGKKAKEIVADIPKEPGFYLWGKYEKKGMWRNVYLGKAGSGETTHLRARILEELNNERCFLWLSVLGKEKVLSVSKACYESMWHKYRAQHERAFRKEGSTHIVWVCDPAPLSNADVATIESDLIETLNPDANLQHRVPPVFLQDHTRDIVASFRSAVHSHRPASGTQSVDRDYLTAGHSRGPTVPHLMLMTAYPSSLGSGSMECKDLRQGGSR